MNSTPTDVPHPSMEVRGSHASSVIIHRVPADRVERFLELQRSISQAAEQFAGFQGTEVYPPADNQQLDWVVIIHFNVPEALQRWLDSSVRAEWVARLRGEIGEFRLQTMPGGFGSWFAREARGPQELPASWKIALTVLLGLYPTVMLLTIFVGPYVAKLGLAASMLIGNALSVALLQWAVMPVLDVVLRPWVQATAAKNKATLIGGLGLILLILGILAVLFRLATG